MTKKQVNTIQIIIALTAIIGYAGLVYRLNYLNRIAKAPTGYIVDMQGDRAAFQPETMTVNESKNYCDLHECLIGK